MNPDLPFLPLAPWIRESFGFPAYRVALDAGSTCPNRDGSKGLGGCTYCDVEGSGTGALRGGDAIAEQLAVGLKRIARRAKPGQPHPRAIAYLQSYTNTYVDLARLEEVLEVIEPHMGKEVVCLSVSTRPDCLPDAALDLLRSVADQVRVWVELGLECADDQILLDINRLHTVTDFREAVQRVHEAGLETVGHAILGLPGDGRAGARRTAQVMAECGVHGVKVHHLMVLKRTQMAAQWRSGELDVLDQDRYVEWLGDFVERLTPHQVLHRLTGESPAEKLLAPHWSIHKNQVRELLAATLRSRGTQQGSHDNSLGSAPLGVQPTG